MSKTENKEMHSELAQREESVVNQLIVVENKHFLEETGPGGYWKVKDGMKEEHFALNEVKEFISDCVEEIASLRSELQKHKELNAELVGALEEIIAYTSFRNMYPATSRCVESLIKKSKELLG